MLRGPLQHLLDFGLVAEQLLVEVDGRARLVFEGFRLGERIFFLPDEDADLGAGAGLPVTVYYTKVGDTLVASKVMVRRESPPAGAPLSAVVVQGTIGEFGSNRIILNPAGSTESVHYAYGETTTYVDEDGHPLAVTTVKSGQPVTIYYTRSGDTLVATKVIVRKELIAPNSVIERKTTTTTTTKEN